MNTSNVFMQPQLISALIGLARACENNPKTPDTDHIIVENVLASANRHLSSQEIANRVNAIHAEKFRVVPGCQYCASPCGNTSDFDMGKLDILDGQSREMKLQLLSRLQQMAEAIVTPGSKQSVADAVYFFFYKALCIVSYEYSAEDLKPVLEESDALMNQL